MILFKNGDLFSFGRNDDGRCGIENGNENILKPQKIEFFKNKKIKDIFCSFSSSLVLLSKFSFFFKFLILLFFYIKMLFYYF